MAAFLGGQATEPNKTQGVRTEVASFVAALLAITGLVAAPCEDERSDRLAEFDLFPVAEQARRGDHAGLLPGHAHEVLVFHVRPEPNGL